MSSQSEAAGKPVLSGFDYHGITFNQLVAVYKEAYVGAGFEFRGLVTRKSETRTRPHETELQFEFTNPQAPHKSKAIRTFRIESSVLGDETCAPCLVFGGTFPGYLGDHDPEEYARFTQVLSNALEVGGKAVVRKLGKGFAGP